MTLIALGLGTVLLVAIAMFSQFSSQRVLSTTNEAKKLSALGIAEAGLSLVLAELRQDPAFATHQLGAQFEWLPQTVNRAVTLRDEAGFSFSLDRGSAGTYIGRLGRGEFRVKVAPMTGYPDDASTTNVDESRSFVKITAMGRVDDMVRVIDAVVQKRYAGREFLMYDGDFLSIVFGQWDDSTGINRFSTGHLYGHRGVEIGRISLKGHTQHVTGTRQALDDVNLISSGLGGIFFYDPTPVGFRSRRDTNQAAFTTTLQANFSPAQISQIIINGPYDEPARKNLGALPKGMLSLTPDQNPADSSLRAAVASYVRDSRTAQKLFPVEPPFGSMKRAAQSSPGYYLTSAQANVDFLVPRDGSSRYTPKRVKIIDFGTNIRTNVSPNEAPPDMTAAGDTIYAECPLVVRGNPPKGLKIVSTEDVFIAGDFNQRGIAGDRAHRYGCPQDYPTAGPNGGGPVANDDYLPALRQRIDQDFGKPPTDRIHQPVHVIAGKRIIYDYRDPRYCFENELYPYLKYQVGQALLDGGMTDAQKKDRARAAILQVPAAGTPPGLSNTETYSDPASLSARLQRLFDTDLAIGLPAADRDALIQRFTTEHQNNGGAFTDDALENLTRLTWEQICNQYPAHAADGQFATKILLDKLRQETQNDHAAGDYLFYPEFTTNGIFESCARRHATFLIGPDQNKHYDEIGNYEVEDDSGNKIAGPHSPSPKGFIHRMYGSEIRLAIKNVPQLSSHYAPGLRRKLYDVRLPTSSLTGHAFLVVVSWKESRGETTAFDAF